MADMRKSCLECGAPLLEDLDHDAFDEPIHLCILDEWLWEEFDPLEERNKS